MTRTEADRAALVQILAETFRKHGFEGATLSVISEATGLGKGSLYHVFPGGKEEMAATVLANIDAWFAEHVFKPLRATGDGAAAVGAMFTAVDEYFRGGGRVCVVGVFAVSDVRDRFGTAVHRYFEEWVGALATTLVRLGHPPDEAMALAEDAVATIQGGLVLARALNDPGAFRRTLARLETRLLTVR